MHRRQILHTILLLLLFALLGLPKVIPVRAASPEFVQLSVAGEHTCGLKSDGLVVCWGSNARGQLNVPDPNRDFIQISAGLRHTCGLKSDLTIVCWGDNHQGQAAVPTLPESLYFTQVSAGELHTCGLVNDGSIVCWGDNQYSQRNVSAPNNGFTQVAAGSRHTCGLKGTQVVCWGENTFGQADVVPGSYQQVTAGSDATCGLTTLGTIICWGYDDYGQVGGTPAGDGYVHLSAGFKFNCALRDSSELRCWGFDSDGQVSSMPLGPEYLQVTVGRYHACAIKNDNTAVCWGDNAYNQAPVITLSPLPGGEAGTAYDAVITASGGTLASPTYTYSLLFDNWLPVGLSLSPNGHLSGIPNTAGTYTFTVRAVDNNSYAATRTYTLNIDLGNPPVSMRVTNSPRTYTGLPQPAEITVDASVPVPGTLDNVRYNDSPNPPAAAGTYAVTADFHPSYTSMYRSLTGVNVGNLVISPAELTVRANDQTRQVGQPNLPLTWTLTGFVNGETAASAGVTGEPEVSTTAGANSLPGNYLIIISQYTDPQRRLGAANYTFIFVNGTLIVTGVPDISLSVTNSPQTYTGLPQAAVVTVAASSPPGTLSNVRYNGSTTLPTAAGTYTVTADFHPQDTVHYRDLAGVGAGSLVIAPAVLAVQANSVSRLLGRPNLMFTWTISGFVNGETAASAGLTGEPSLSTTADAYSLPGLYPITITQNSDPNHRLAAPNYTFTFVNGTLTVTGTPLFLPLVM